MERFEWEVNLQERTTRPFHKPIRLGDALSVLAMPSSPTSGLDPRHSWRPRCTTSKLATSSWDFCYYSVQIFVSFTVRSYAGISIAKWWNDYGTQSLLGDRDKHRSNEFMTCLCRGRLNLACGSSEIFHRTGCNFPYAAHRFENTYVQCQI